MNNKRVKGLWFFGMSGSGKTYLSKILKNKIKNSVLVDGDVVRKYVSFDLGYSLKDREHQILGVRYWKDHFFGKKVSNYFYCLFLIKNY